MGGGGGGDNNQGSTTYQPPINNNVPLQQHLTGLADNQLHAAIPYMSYGAGYQLAPQGAFGQVAMPGPNQTIYGNPFNQQNSVGSFGQPAQYPTNVGFQSTPQGYAPPGYGYTPPQANYGMQGQPFQNYFQGIMPQSGTPGPFNPQVYPQYGYGGPPQQGNYPYLPGTGPAPANPAPNPTQNTPPPPLQGGPAGPAATQAPPIPSGLTAPDPWAGTQNARTQDNPGTNWNPDGTYNPNGPYYQNPGVGPDGQPLPTNATPTGGK